MPSFPAQGGSAGAWGTELENFFTPFFDFATGEFRMNGGSLANPIIGFKTSPATGIFSPGLNQLGVAVNGVQALLFSPLGDATFRNISAISYTGDGSALTGIASGTGGVINTGSTTIGADSDSTGGGEIAFQIKGISEVVLNNAGNLGVGTSSPSSQLTVGGALDFLNLNTPPPGPGFYLGINTLQTRMGTGGLTVKDSLNASVRLSILDDGNVGIGTSNPTSKLHVFGTGQYTDTQVFSKVGSPSSAATFFSSGTGAIAAIFGSGSTLGLTSDQYGGAIRFNGASVLWGDMSFYPSGGDAGEQGHFRLSTTSAILDTTPSGKLGVGELYSVGSIAIGTTTPNTNALLDVSSTTKAFMPPRMTTTQRDAIPSPTKGMMIYNITTNVPDHYNGTAWGAV